MYINFINILLLRAILKYFVYNYVSNKKKEYYTTSICQLSPQWFLNFTLSS